MRPRLTAVLVTSVLLGLGAGSPAVAGRAQPVLPDKQAVATGAGGAAATVDPLATQAAIEVLRDGGNAVDAAIAASAMINVVEPYACGIGGGGFMVIYLAADGQVVTIDSREEAPAAFEPGVFLDPTSGEPIPFPELVTSGLGVGVPGTPRGWQAALDQHGTTPLADLLEPAIAVAETGFVVDEAFTAGTQENFERFRAFSSTAELFLPGGQVPPVGSVLRNPDLADTFQLLSEQGVDAFYEGEVADAIVDAVQDPPVTADATLNVRPGLMEVDDLADYAAIERDPTKVSYRGYEVYGMGPPSSGGSTVGEALNILEGFDLAALSPAERLHRYLEASRLAYADRNSYLGDPAFVDVPLSGLLADAFAAERRALIGPSVPTERVPPGDPYPFEGEPGTAPAAARGDSPEGRSTTHITTSDADGSVVAYTCTIEQFGGSGIVVDGYGFLLNNELTDFEPEEGLANSPEAGKRPRSSMSPTIVLRDGEPVLALGSPGGATIITTVLQTLLNHFDAGMALPEAIAAPRASQRNAATTEAEPGFLATPETAALSAVGHQFSETTSLDGSIGAATGIAFLGDGRVQAAAEPCRRGGGSAMVEQPDTP